MLFPRKIDGMEGAQSSTPRAYYVVAYSLVWDGSMYPHPRAQFHRAIPQKFLNTQADPTARARNVPLAFLAFLASARQRQTCHTSPSIIPFPVDIKTSPVRPCLLVSPGACLHLHLSTPVGIYRIPHAFSPPAPCRTPPISHLKAEPCPRSVPPLAGLARPGPGI